MIFIKVYLLGVLFSVVSILMPSMVEVEIGKCLYEISTDKFLKTSLNRSDVYLFHRYN